MSKTSLPPGVADELPPFASNNLEAKRILLQTFIRAGFEPVSPPPFEYLASLSVEDENTQMLKFSDPVSHRMLALRNDFTPQLVRIASTKMAKYPRPLRLCYCGEVVAAQGTMLHPNRCWSQAGLEIFGFENNHVKEVILLGLEALENCGIKDLSVDLNYPPLWNILTQDDAALEKAVTRKNSSALRKIGTPQANALATILDLPTAAAKVVKAATELPNQTRQIIASLAELAEQINAELPQVKVTIDPLERRGFSYYKGVTFSYFSKGIRSEIGRGGHYTASSTPSKVPVSRQASGSKSRKSNNNEEAIGLSLFTDILTMSSGGSGTSNRKILAPQGAKRSIINRLRSNGEIVLENGDPKRLATQAQQLGCAKILEPNGKVVPAKR